MSAEKPTKEDILTIINKIKKFDPKARSIELDLDYVPDEVIYQLSEIGYSVKAIINTNRLRINLK